MTTTTLLPEIEQRWSPLVFQAKPVERTKIEAILEAARHAPSSYNHQPWRYLVAISEAALGKIHKTRKSYLQIRSANIRKIESKNRLP